MLYFVTFLFGMIAGALCFAAYQCYALWKSLSMDGEG